ncbi:MAG: OPT/YSL family transporter [Planctomycetota bacterium]
MTSPPHTSSLIPRLGPTQWLVFAMLAAVICAANIYTTLLIGWGDTGSIVAVLASVAFLGLAHKKATIYELNLGQTMVSAGGSIGFVVACYAAVHIVKPDWRPNSWHLVLLFASVGVLGTLVGNLVRRQMVQYFFPSGTACAVIQRAVAAERAPGEVNRPVRLLKIWSLIAAALTFPTKASFVAEGHALWSTLKIKLGLPRLAELQIGVDPLYYGIGMVVGPRIGVGMILGALLPSLWIVPMLTTADGSPHPYGPIPDWVRWTAIAVLTLPTFAAILFAYQYRVQATVPPGFTPGRTPYLQPSSRRVLHTFAALLGVTGAVFAGQLVFNLPWIASVATIALAVPLSVVNGRVSGDTDINPVRLVAIVLISAFFWLVAKDAVVLLGMAVIGATVASVAVDMMQDMRTGHLLDQDPGHQVFVQFLGVIVGAFAAIPVLNLLVERFGVGEGSALRAPAAQLWAAMANAMSGGTSFSNELIGAIAVVSVIGIFYAWLTVYPKTAPWMPSLFGIGIGLLLGLDAAMAIFLGGMLKQLALFFYTRGKSGAAREDAAQRGGDDTMVVGASVFAAGAVLSILLVLLDFVFTKAGVSPWSLATG